MGHFVKDNQKLRPRFAVLSVVTTVFVVAAMLWSVMGGNAYAANSANDGGNISLYNTAAGAAVYFDMIVSHNRSDDIVSSSAEALGRSEGGLAHVSGALGFPDLDAINFETMESAPDMNSEGWVVNLTGKNSKNTAVYGFNAFGTDDLGETVRAYGNFGRALSTLGLDETIMGDGIGSPSRFIIGHTMQAVYYMASGADDIMNGIIKALRFTNPFRLFFDVETSQNKNGETEVTLSSNPDKEITDAKTDGITGDTGGWDRNNNNAKLYDDNTDVDGNIQSKDDPFNKDGSIFEIKGVSDLANQLIGIYRTLYGMSTFILLPLTGIVGIATYLMGRASIGKNSSILPKVRRYVIRLFFLVGGIPMLGMCYTATLEHLADSDIGDNGMSYEVSRLVMRSFVDFGSWAEKSNLAVNDDMTIAVDENGNVADESYNKIGDTVWAINKIGLEEQYPEAFKDDNVPEASSAKGQVYGYWIDALDESQKTPEVTADQRRAIVTYLLDSYASGDVYSGAAFESYITGQIIDEKKSDANVRREYLRSCSNPETYAEGLSKLVGDSEAEIKPVGVLRGEPVNYMMSINTREELDDLYNKLNKVRGDATDEEIEAIRKEIEEVLKKESEAKENSGAKDSMILVEGHYFNTGSLQYTPGTGANKASIITYKSSDGKTGLSDVGMYNYLNTRFDAGEFSVYSTPRSTNTQSHPSHYRVTLAGGGVLGVLMAVNAGLAMFAVAITAVIYGLGLLVSSVKRSFSLIVSLPMAFTGMTRSIAHSILLALALVCEILGTYIAYLLMKSMLIGVNETIKDGVVARFISDMIMTVGGNNAAAALISSIIGYLVACVLLILYIILALRLRLAISNGLTDLVASIISRITDVNPGDVTNSGTGFGRALSVGAMSDIGKTAVTGGAAAAMGMGGLAFMGANGDNGITVGGASAEANGGAGGEGGEGEGGSSMLTGNYASEGTIEGADRQGGTSHLASVATGSDAYADASSSSDAMGGLGGASDAMVADGSVGRALASSAYSSSSSASDAEDGTGTGGTGTGGSGVGGAGGAGGASGMRGVAQGESALANAVGVGGNGAVGAGGVGIANASGMGYADAADGSTLSGGNAVASAGSAGGNAVGLGVAAANGEGGVGYGSAILSGGQNVAVANSGATSAGGNGLASAVGNGGMGYGASADGSTLTGGSANASSLGSSAEGGSALGADAQAAGYGSGYGVGYGQGGNSGNSLASAVGTGMGYSNAVDGSVVTGGSAHARGGEGGASDVAVGDARGGDALGASVTASADAYGLGGNAENARAVAVGGAGMGYGVGGDGSAIGGSALGGAGYASAAGGNGLASAGFRDSGGAYDRDMGGSVRITPGSGTQSAESMRTLQAAMATAAPTSRADVDLGAAAPQFAGGVIAPNAAGSGQGERIREVQGRTSTSGLTSLGGALHAESASIGSAHSESTLGGDVRANGGVGGDRMRDVRATSGLGSAVSSSSHGAAGTAGAAGMGRDGFAGSAGGASVAQGGAAGAAGAPGGSGGSAVGGGGGGAFIDGTRDVRATSGTAPRSGSAPLSASVAGVGGAAGAAGASGRAGAAGVAGRAGAMGASGRSGVGGMSGRAGAAGAAGAAGMAGMAGSAGVVGRSGASERAGSRGQGTVSHTSTQSVGVGASAAPAGNKGASRAGASERFGRAMDSSYGRSGARSGTSRQGGRSNSRRGGASGSGGVDLGESLSGGNASKGVDTASFSSRDPLGK